METAERFRTVVDFLAENFSCGTSSVSREDVIDEGTLLADEIDAVLGDRAFVRAASGRTADALAALDTIRSVWQGGYDLASGDDFATDDETVSTIICDMSDELGEGAPVPA